ncbi:hypothetical protein B0J18DRAFT_240996 [Chaetomium sp. MPI-SDFR-AT-0129]|nr:hypothetical protein B0J18DRAFT_240996 [Chaetomium sp. MPI-SDFR-AT-0129]
MKRKAVDPAHKPTLESVPPRHSIPASQLVHIHNGQHAAQGVQSHGRRQPQTSCDSCRKRKLKCDRGQPCSSCVTRGLPCEGQQGLLGPLSGTTRTAIDTRLVVFALLQACYGVNLSG